MDKNKKAPASIDGYISAFPLPIQKKLEEIRKAVRETAPGAVEKISYRMPAFYQNGILVYFAAFGDHIGFFPTSSGVAAFKKELLKYKTTKGAIHFPLDAKVPIGLVKKIVKFRVKENAGKKK
jgi:uncharacterized protein YdhG (YjbR/CyaY superfamily)